MLTKEYLIFVDLWKKKTDYNAKITEIGGKIPTMPDNIWTGLENFRIFFCALLDSYQQSLISV